jgi:transcriptional regulator with XRE-family HTH domain
MAKKTVFMKWIDRQLRADSQLAREVDELINEMKIEQELVALREKRGLSQRDLAERLGTTQPYVAKLESGRIKNLGLKTLAKYATALDARLTVRLEPRHAAPTARAATKTTKPRARGLRESERR